MNPRSRHLLPVLLVSALLLSACGHARVVRMEPAAQRDAMPKREPSARPASAPARPAPASPTAPAAPQPIPGGDSYVVQQGETLYGISRRYGLSFREVAAWNGIAEPYAIQAGQRLRLRAPGAAPVASTPARPAATVTATPAIPPPASPGPKPATTGEAGPPVASGTGPAAPSAVPSAPASTASVPVAPAASVPASAPVAATDSPSPATPAPAIAGGPRWRWPAQGQIIGRYVAGDPTQQGIDIAGKPGQSITAAADGVVVYSGAGLVGYGELIIVKHSDEWLSAYAHNRRRLVAEGAKVKAGDVIAEMGRTGAIREMLHFEIRRNGKPVDPLSYLPKP